MKNSIIIMIFSLSSHWILYSQTVSVEELSNYIAGNVEGDFEYDTLRDTSGIYDDYLGHWRYSNTNDQIDFFITKETTIFFGRSMEYLTVRYEIRQNGQIIVSSIGESIDDFKVVTAASYNESGFFSGAFFPGIPCSKAGGLYFKYISRVEFPSGNRVEVLEVFPGYTSYGYSGDGCNNVYSEPVPDYFIMERM